MIERILGTVGRSVRHRVWVVSDLQQSIPEKAERCMTTAVADFRSLELACERIWYLGDAVEGNRPEFLAAMCDMQVRVLGELGIPLRYVAGNHDFDSALMDANQKPRAWFREAVAKVPGWKTTESLESFYFLDELGDYLVVFFSDHGDPGGRWLTTHGELHRDKTAYPYSAEDYLALRGRIASSGQRVITAGHYPFAGGNRPSALLSQMLPLPENVKIHFYGHAHIGDAKCVGKDLYRKLAVVDNQAIPQIDVASLENDRGSAIRSVIFEIYEDRSMGIYFRDHGKRKWDEAYWVGDQSG